ncbi:MAG: hypothetical protein KBT03_01350 [Bacteroidales bacterium]|nr:hypothetical protein [Candidatus Scybalousia scybalohippi]
MIKIENVVLPSCEQMERIIMGARNPMNSWERSDSTYSVDDNIFAIGKNDFDLLTRLSKAGAAHAKYKRMINVYCDITAPMYWWKEYDTYLHTVRNSCSTMHKIHSKEFTIDDFSIENIFNGFNGNDNYDYMNHTVDILEKNRKVYLSLPEGEEKKIAWWQMIQMLPSSYNQRSTVMMNYETLTAMYRWRRNHKLDEWQEFCDWIETLPYSELITQKYEMEDD